MQFPIAIHKDTNSVYGVTVPDIEGCFSWGNTLDDAICNAKEAIYSHVETLLELNESVDFKASQIEELSVLDDFKGAIWAVVDIDTTMLDPTPERVNVSLPRFILQKIKQYTDLNHETRSGFLARAALRELNK